jgi:hypothetical protein
MEQLIKIPLNGLYIIKDMRNALPLASMPISALTENHDARL